MLLDFLFNRSLTLLKDLVLIMHELKCVHENNVVQKGQTLVSLLDKYTPLRKRFLPFR